MSGEPSWTIVMGDNFTFSIERDRPGVFWSLGSYGDLNGRFLTKAEAIDEVISAFEETRATLSVAIARAKRMRRRAPSPSAGS